MSRRLKTGAIVQLKSGGPEMTVREYSKSDDNFNNVSETEVVCEWFSHELKQAVFHQDSLIKVNRTIANLMNKM
jgi:uncharacterized protein YodC (DUF2158 family)